ncbi:hypothetical protein PLCT1_01697 [Planctomycetaceae bacterium]|nr:hypothetical protein PLCT1_01697 [Planctomycetaceae bacterium]
MVQDKRTHYRFLRVTALLLLMLVLSGCGYRVGSTLDDRPPRSVEFGTVENQLFPPRPGMEYGLTRRLKEEMALDPRLKLVGSSAQVRLRVTLVGFDEPTIVKNLETTRSSEILLRATVVVEAVGEVEGGKTRRTITTNDGYSPALGDSREAALERLWRNLSRQVIDAATDWEWAGQ